MSQAARLGDPIEHTGSLTGLLAGLAIGAIGAALIVGTGGLAAVAIVGASATAGAGIGQLIGSLSVCDHSTGQIQSGSANVFINGKPAARAHLDTALCDEHGPAPQVLAQGSDTVYINGVPAARVGDRTVCDAKISSGSGNVVIGGGTQTTDSIQPEVPEWLERSLLVVGLGSALVLASPIVVAAGLVGGIAGGAAGHWAGGKLFGAGSNGQKLMTFGAGLLGGGLGAKGGKWFDARYEIKTQGLGSNFGNLRIVPKYPEETYYGILRGNTVKLPAVKAEPLIYVKRSSSELNRLRRKFNSTERKAFLKNLSNSSEKVYQLEKYGFTKGEIAYMQSGKVPNKDWQVHHIKPLDDGGNNAFENLTLIRNDPYHTSITNAQNAMAKGMKPGDMRIFDWPIIDVDIYPPAGVL